jgi:hypothetical protein
MVERSVALALTLATVISAPGCHKKKPLPGPEVPSVVLEDFEDSPAVTKWPKEHPGDVGISTDWKVDGAHSLKIDPGLLAYYKDLDIDDWSSFGLLRITVHNGSDKTTVFGLELQDTHEDFYDRHQHAFGVEPGDHVVELDIAGGLWRGEENAPYRGEEKSPLDLRKITRVGFSNNGDKAIWVDHLELVRVPKIETKGGFAFDFGRKGKQVGAQAIGVYETTKFEADKGFGFIGEAPVGLGKAMSYPTPLLGDGLPLAGGFRVDLAGGDYVGWIAFERGGFWEAEATGYSHADVKLNGAVVTGHDFTPTGPHFLFEDLEITDPKDIVDKLVWPSHQVTRFKFKAAAGQNVFTIDTKDLTGPPLRVAGLLLAPDTPEGNAFLDKHEAAQKETATKAFTPQDRGRRDAHDRRTTPAAALVIEPMAAGAPMYPRDWPTNAQGAPLAPATAIAGETVTIQLGAYTNAQAPIVARLEAHELAGPDKAKIAAASLSYGKYLPMRARDVGAAWLEVSHYVPLDAATPTITVGPNAARAIVAEYKIPDDAKPGDYVGDVVFEPLKDNGDKGDPVKIAVRLKVIDVKLPELPMPVGLLMNALPFSTAVLDEPAWWKLQEALLEAEGNAGLNTVTGGPGLEYTARKSDNGYDFAGPRALKYLELAKKHAMGRAVVPYGGFLPPLRRTRADAEPFARGWNKFEKDNGLPPHFLYAYDEPGTERETKDALNKLLPFTKAGMKTLGFTSIRSGDRAWDQLVEGTYAPAISVHDTASLKALRDKGRHVWVYNQGLDRYGMGLELWRSMKLGVEGRLEWIGVNTQGFAFNNLDGREPARGAFLVHDKLGVLSTPRWLAAREGLLDARLRLALEAAVPKGDPALATWTTDGYRTDEAKWTEVDLEGARQKMLDRLAAVKK